MRVRVLGSAAGGGFPQWNCGCENCLGVRAGSPEFVARSQESVAISADGHNWFLLNASPEIRAQIESFAGLHPRAPRHSPIAGIVLTNGDLDHCLGLLSLRESYPLRLYATRSVEHGFRSDNVLYRTLQRFPDQVRFEALALGAERALLRADGSESGLFVRAIPVAGKLPIHLEAQSKPSPEDNIGLLVREAGSGKTLAYFPAVARGEAELARTLGELDALFFDGTFWSSDELPGQGLGEKHAEDMAHWPVGGAGGSAGFLAELPVRRRIYIHINNTNPMLRASSAQAQQLTAAGIEIAVDGLELQL
jgi:pyrroloquinoline quinone biosynthesis protein B